MESTTTSSTSSATEADYFNTLIAHATANNFSVAVWRLPDNKTKHLIISRKHELLKQDTPLEELPMGFIFAPFDRAADRIFLKADLAFTFQGRFLKTSVESSRNNFRGMACYSFEEYTTPPESPISQINVQPSATARQAFMDIVAHGIREIEQGTFEKIVPSRTQLIDLGSGFDIVTVVPKSMSR